MKSKEIRQQARDLKCEGYTFKDISEFLGMSYACARNLCVNTCQEIWTTAKNNKSKCSKC